MKEKTRGIGPEMGMGMMKKMMEGMGGTSPVMEK